MRTVTLIAAGDAMAQPGLDWGRMLTQNGTHAVSAMQAVVALLTIVLSIVGINATLWDSRIVALQEQGKRIEHRVLQVQTEDFQNIRRQAEAKEWDPSFPPYDASKGVFFGSLAVVGDGWPNRREYSISSPTFDACRRSCTAGCVAFSYFITTQVCERRASVTDVYRHYDADSVRFYAAASPHVEPSQWEYYDRSAFVPDKAMVQTYASRQSCKDGCEAESWCAGFTSRPPDICLRFRSTQQRGRTPDQQAFSASKLPIR